MKGTSDGFKEAKQSGDILIVMLKSDEQLIKKKGKNLFIFTTGMQRER